MKLISLYIIRDIWEVNLVKNPKPLGVGVSVTLFSINVCTIDQNPSASAAMIECYSGNEWIMNVKNDGTYKAGQQLIIISKNDKNEDCGKEAIFIIKK